MTIELKIKNKHLSEESRIIRTEENKIKSQYKRQKISGRNDVYEEIQTKERMVRNLAQHRRWDVRNEQRATYLARAFIVGKSRSFLENKWNNGFNYYLSKRVFNMVKKYGNPDVTTQEIDAWLKG